MSDRVLAEPAEMRASATRLEQAMDGIRGRIGDLESSLGTLQGQWTGAAQDAYTDAQTRWNTGMDTLAGLVGQIGEAMTTAATAIEHTDRQVAGSFGR
jgi:6 kDa early secretory antigenic target